MLVNVSNIFGERMAVLLMQRSPVPISLNTTRPFGSKLLWAACIAHYYEDVSELQGLYSLHVKTYLHMLSFSKLSNLVR